MRFLIELIFCIGAAYGIGWFYSSYYGRRAHGGGNRPKRQRTGGLAVVHRIQQPESGMPMPPSRDKSWLS